MKIEINEIPNGTYEQIETTNHEMSTYDGSLGNIDALHNGSITFTVDFGRKTIRQDGYYTSTVKDIDLDEDGLLTVNTRNSTYKYRKVS